ncbi:uncharacterized protein C553.10 [Phoenix dactylifera]|uniref:Uncharacterized protein C553.10 n=1 Tax=Phoenix dactylifera TaxID=42345 RepID=A0A8B7BX10_PHODC|nr:uncharacterized protein C553.10 [Phoenix dactylifera]
MAQQQQEKWVTFDEEEEALSLSDFPVIADGAKHEEKRKPSPDPVEDFEFRVSVGGGLLSKAAETDMCAADEVFFQGQILPLRPSVSSDSSLFSTSRCASRSESMDRYSSAISSLGSCESSRSNSSSSTSSNSVSRSHSSSSRSSIICDPPRASVSNNFYTHPSPTPQVRIVGGRRSAGRRSISSSAPGWGILRLGVVKTPEIELYDLRSRRSSSGGVNNHPKRINGDAEHRKKVSEANDGSRSAACTHDADGKRKGEEKVEKKVQWLMGRGFGCKCSLDSVEIISSKVVIAKKKKEEGEGLKRGESMCRSRIFEWLEDLSVTKATGN